jgi:hypothetical protein
MLVSTELVYEFEAPADSQVDIMNKELSRINRIMVCGRAFTSKKQGFFSKIKNCLFNGLFYGIK